MAFTKTKTNCNKMVVRTPRTVCFLNSETKRFEVVEFNMILWDEKDVASIFVKAKPVTASNGNKYINLYDEVVISSTKAAQEYFIPALLDTKTPEVFIAKAEPSSEIFFQFSEEEMNEIINQLESIKGENDEV